MKPSPWDKAVKDPSPNKKEKGYYYLRIEINYQWLAYPPRLAVELGSYVIVGDRPGPSDKLVGWDPTTVCGWCAAHPTAPA